MEKKLYGEIENEPGQTKSLGFQAAMFLIQGRGEAKANADLKPALEGSVNELDKPGRNPYQWTLRYIEQAAGVGVGELVAPTVTFGPFATTYNKQACWLCKVAYHVPGDNRPHCAIVYEEPVIGPEHVIRCVIDF